MEQLRAELAAASKVGCPFCCCALLLIQTVVWQSSRQQPVVKGDERDAATEVSLRTHSSVFTTPLHRTS